MVAEIGIKARGVESGGKKGGKKGVRSEGMAGVKSKGNVGLRNGVGLEGIKGVDSKGVKSRGTEKKEEMACRASATRIVKMRAKKDLSQRAKEMGDRKKMTTGATRTVADAKTTPKVAQPSAVADA